MSLPVFVQFPLGLVLLLAGGELLVRGSVRLASALGLPSLVIGLTIVAFGTGSPELAVSLNAVYSETPDISLGTIVGSNLVNVLLVLGASALVAPLAVSRRIVKFDVPVMIAVSVGLFALAWNTELTRIDGLILTVAGISYFVVLVLQGRREVREQHRLHAKAKPSEIDPESPPTEAEIDEVLGHIRRETRFRGMFWLIALVLFGSGLGMLLVGADWLVESASEIAGRFQVSEAVIGVTVVALGTSLPELVVSIVASIKGERDLAVGNVVGSNIFNIVIVVGLTAALAPTPLIVPDGLLNFGIPLMVAVALAVFPIVFTGFKIARWEGFLFLAYYVAFLIYLYFRATEHDALPRFNLIMFSYVGPITILTLVITALHAAHRGKHPSIEDTTSNHAVVEETAKAESATDPDGITGPRS